MKTEPILVCGAGIAGLAMALGAARAGQAVALLGPRPALPAAQPDVYHPRVYAMSPASQALLSSLGVWRLLDAARVTPVTAMQVHGDAGGQVQLRDWHLAQPALAWIIESSELERALRQAIDVLGVEWRAASFLRREGAMVMADDGSALPAALLIGADGARSAVRMATGIAHHAKPYGDAGVVTHLDAELPHQGTAMQWFLGDSILALLPMPDTAQGPQVSMVWSMPQAQADALLALPEPARNEQLQRRLAHATAGALGRLTVRAPVHAFPLSLEHSDMVGDRVALISDAGHRVHPLAGQGLNLGLGDVADLLRVLHEREPWRSVADPRVLARYRRARAQPLLEMRLATDGLHRLFSVPSPVLMMARNAGMQAVGSLPFLKRWLIAAAAGRMPVPARRHAPSDGGRR